MTNPAPTNNAADLVADLLRHEGERAYFPYLSGADLARIDCHSVLVQYLEAHPDEWSSGTEDSASDMTGLDLGALHTLALESLGGRAAHE